MHIFLSNFKFENLINNFKIHLHFTLERCVKIILQRKWDKLKKKVFPKKRIKDNAYKLQILNIKFQFSILFFSFLLILHPHENCNNICQLIFLFSFFFLFNCESKCRNNNKINSVKFSSHFRSITFEICRNGFLIVNIHS